MGRELIGDLFNRPVGQDGEQGGFSDSSSVGYQRMNAHMAAPSTPAGTAKMDDLKVLYLHMENMSKRLMEMESKVELMGTKSEDMWTQNKQRFERVQGHFRNQGEMMKSGFADVNGKIAQVVSRVNERRLNESAIQEMVERHSQTVQNFDVRMQQLQRVISEQELQLMNARTELKEALQELGRLKKL